MPFFSIIVPVYHTEKYLEKCINSILSQAFLDYELILIDDGSNDNCPKICDMYAKKDSRVITIHKENGGVSSARNVGIDKAKGKYIWFIDSDDYIEWDSLKEIYNLLIENNASLYVFNTIGVDGVFDISFDQFLKDFYFTYIVGFGPCNKIYSTSIIKENHIYFDEEETIGEDLLFNVLYYKNLYKQKFSKSICFINHNYYFYVNRCDSAMNTSSKERIIQQLRIFDKIEEMISMLIKKENLIYLFWMHLISGIGQSIKGGLTINQFASVVDFIKYEDYIKNFKIIKERFFINERATILGKIRVCCFSLLMRLKKYRLAGMVMGLKR